jgi:hypothetical protein
MRVIEIGFRKDRGNYVNTAFVDIDHDGWIIKCRVVWYPDSSLTMSRFCLSLRCIALRRAGLTGSTDQYVGYCIYSICVVMQLNFRKIYVL